MVFISKSGRKWNRERFIAHACVGMDVCGMHQIKSCYAKSLARSIDAHSVLIGDRANEIVANTCCCAQFTCTQFDTNITSAFIGSCVTYTRANYK